MGQTLTHGVYLPDEGERNCYSGLAANWQLLDSSVGTIASHTTQIAGKAPAVHTHTVSDITDFPAYGTTAGTICEGNDSRLSDARTPIAHTHGKADITDLFNTANTWTALNSYSNGQIRIKSQSQEIGVTPSNSVIQYLEFADKNDAQHGKVGLLDYTNGASEIQMSITDKYKNGVKDSTGIAESTFLSFGFKTDGSKFFTFAGQIQNSLIPNANNTYGLGSSSYQWNNLYAKGYYYNGVAWGLDKANVWTGNNQYNESIRINGQKGINWARGGTVGTLPSSVLYYGFQNALDSNDNVFDRIRSYVGTAGTNLQEHVKYAWNDLTKYVTINYWINADGSDSEYKLSVKRVIPGASNATDLGTSTNKWKSFNGVNPGALSLPDIAKYTDLTSNIPSASLGGNTDIDLSSYITSNGWLSIAVPDTNTDDYVFCQNGSNLSNRFFMSGARGNGFISLMMPINRAGAVNVQIKASSVTFCRFYKCLGNV